MDSLMMHLMLIKDDDESYSHNNIERRDGSANDVGPGSDVRG